jgi:transposase-like protein
VKTSNRSIWEEYLQSALTQREFCQERGICLSTLHHWRRKGEELSIPPGAASPAFVPVRLKQSISVAEPMQVEILLPGDVTVRVAQGLNPAGLAALIKELRQSC